MLSIRMRRTGSKKRPFYRVVVTEGRDAARGQLLEVLGIYNPRTKPAVVEIDKARVEHWIKKGARPSDSVRTLLARHLTKDRGRGGRAGDGRARGAGRVGSCRGGDLKGLVEAVARALADAARRGARWARASAAA